MIEIWLYGSLACLVLLLIDAVWFTKEEEKYVDVEIFSLALFLIVISWIGAALMLVCICAEIIEKVNFDRWWKRFKTKIILDWRKKE